MAIFFPCKYCGDEAPILVNYVCAGASCMRKEIERKKNWGTSGGIELTDELIDKLSKEAEKGYDSSKLKERKSSENRN